jgi:hypothetical protein
VGKTPLGLWNRSAELLCCVKPFLNDLLGIFHRLLVCAATGHAPRQFRDICYKGLILRAPEDDDLVLRINDYSSNIRLYLKNQSTHLLHLVGLALATFRLKVRI